MSRIKNIYYLLNKSLIDTKINELISKKNINSIMQLIQEIFDDEDDENFIKFIYELLSYMKENNLIYEINIVMYLIFSYIYEIEETDNTICINVLYTIIVIEWHNGNINIELPEAYQFYLEQVVNYNLVFKWNIQKERKNNNLEKSNNVYLDILNELIISEWHMEHEDIARELQIIKSPLSVNYLYKAINFNFEYLEWDDNFSLAIKCIWALGDIKNENSLHKLKILLLDENEIIFENALYQILRIAIEKQLIRELNMVINLINKNKIYDKSFTPINIMSFNKLLLVNWHNSHKKIIFLIMKFKDISSIDYLFQVLKFNLDDTIFCIKCMKAIIKITLDNSNKYMLNHNKSVKQVVIKNFEILSICDNEVICKNAIKQLQILLK